MRSFVVALLAGALAWSGLAVPVAPASVAADTPGGRLVEGTAAAATPHVLDGRVYSVAQVGNTILLGGTFSRVRNDRGDTTELKRRRLVAFDATTGTIVPGFAPNPNGDVNAVIPAGDGTSVYVGGTFTTIGGVARQRVARIRVSDGAVLTGFSAGAVAGAVKDLRLRDGRLWVAGAFTHIGGRAQKALATLDPTTGSPLPYMSLAIDGIHNDGVTQVLKLDIDPSGDRLVAIGNFDTLAGVRSHQLLTLDIAGGSAAPGPLRTGFYLTPCVQSFDTYMRDVDYSPDGRYFVVGTTGGYDSATTACDTVARFESSAAGTNVRPSWIDSTGGDTTLSVEATAGVVYVGGHQRWWNNPFASNRADQGAVSREGIAALDPVNGLPLTWNPGRDKGVGVFDFLHTSRGLWVTSDTDRIAGGQYKARVARFDPDGVSIPAIRTTVLPNDVYSAGAGPGAASLTRRAVSETSVGSPRPAPTGNVDWTAVRGAFMVNGSLYVAHANGSFTTRTYDGTTYGPATAVNTADQIVPLTDWTADVRAATGMFYDNGRIYFTRSDSDSLFYRYFSPQSGVVGALRLVASSDVAGFATRSVRGMFVTPSHLYWAATDGTLRRTDWAQRGASGVPLAGTTRVVSGPAVEGARWGAPALFVFQGPGGTPAPPPSVSFVGAARANDNTTTHRVTVPQAVRAGDTLLLYLTLNDSDVTLQAPAGWTQLDAVTGAGAQGRSWTRTATAADVGSSPTVTTSAPAKGDLAVQAYRGTGGTSRVTAHAASIDAEAGTSDTAPAVATPAGSRLVMQWVSKSSVDHTWTAPSGTAQRGAAAGTGGGRLTSIGVDSDAPAASAAARTATSSASVSTTVMFSTAVGIGTAPEVDPPGPRVKRKTWVRITAARLRPGKPTTVAVRASVRGLVRISVRVGGRTVTRSTRVTAGPPARVRLGKVARRVGQRGRVRVVLIPSDTAGFHRSSTVKRVKVKRR